MVAPFVDELAAKYRGVVIRFRHVFASGLTSGRPLKRPAKPGSPFVAEGAQLPRAAGLADDERPWDLLRGRIIVGRTDEMRILGDSTWP